MASERSKRTPQKEERGWRVKIPQRVTFCNDSHYRLRMTLPMSYSVYHDLSALHIIIFNASLAASSSFCSLFRFSCSIFTFSQHYYSLPTSSCKNSLIPSYSASCFLFAVTRSTKLYYTGPTMCLPRHLLQSCGCEFLSFSFLIFNCMSECSTYFLSDAENKENFSN